jgi:hypothetical protein
MKCFKMVLLVWVEAVDKNFDLLYNNVAIYNSWKYCVFKFNAILKSRNVEIRNLFKIWSFGIYYHVDL